MGLRYPRRRGALGNGKDDGEEKAKIEIAQKMKAKGMDVDTIIEITGLKKEEIEKL